MNSPRFKVDDKVVVKHQLDLGVCVVVDPQEATTAQHFKGSELVDVVFYVRIDSPKSQGLGYHESSLDAYVEPVVPVVIEAKTGFWNRVLDFLRRFLGDAS